jgi:hypothetical protein
MSGQVAKTTHEPPARAVLRLELTAGGYLRICREDAERFFPEGTLLALWRDDSLWLLPTRGAAAGGLMLKQRNVRGDRSLLISEVFEFQIPVGSYSATWDDNLGGLRMEVNRELA